MIKIIPNKKDIGAEIECDLKKISNQDLKKIKQALYRYGVIFFRKNTSRKKRLSMKVKGKRRPFNRDSNYLTENVGYFRKNFHIS